MILAKVVQLGEASVEGPKPSVYYRAKTCISNTPFPSYTALYVTGMHDPPTRSGPAQYLWVEMVKCLSLTMVSSS
jgi:hypothetical protein